MPFAGKKTSVVDGMALVDEPDPPPCVACARAKVTTAPTPKRRTSYGVAADRVCHIDLAGPIARSYHGSEHFMASATCPFLDHPSSSACWTLSARNAFALTAGETSVGLWEHVKGYRVYVPDNAPRIRESPGVLALEHMLYDEVVLPDDDVPPPPEGGGVDEEDLDEEDVETGYELPVAPTSTTKRNPRQMEAVRDAVRSTHWSREAVVETSGDARLTETRASERLSARKIGKLMATRTSKRLEDKPINAAYVCFTEVTREPLNLADARKMPHWSVWEKVTWTEVRVLEDNDTYELVHLPVGTHALDNTVQLQLELTADGSIEKYKARVCARGDRQVYLIDYVESGGPRVRESLPGIRVQVQNADAPRQRTSCVSQCYPEGDRVRETSQRFRETGGGRQSMGMEKRTVWA
ncbi:unnamed protein product [Phytophthora fragariaefolia]|uniref:Unnamed protein product n=1 Tax=Phytophthora fragariaefolia TaxID=1490495 RepID=A0A9W6WQK6_9STRA|nr:unnamed protein product [Phytophthora fragariaefolia]